MPNLIFIVSCFFAAAVGFILAWIYCRQQRMVALTQLEAQLKENQQALASRLAVAEEKSSHIPELNARLAERDQSLESARQARSELEAKLAALTAQTNEEREQALEKIALLEDVQKKLGETFQALSAQALAQNNQSFLDLAKTAFSQIQEKAAGELTQKQAALTELLTPVRESLAKVDSQIHEMEKSRAGAYEALITQVKSLTETQQQLRHETGNLSRALQSPVVRGRWGEIQLRRVVELAGMIEHCDFFEQESVNSEEGRLRPDLLVKMPGGKTIVIDSKASIHSYLESLEISDPAGKKERLCRHASTVKDHIRKLGSKDYSAQFKEAPEFVVLFLPGEMFFSAALENDPSLIEFGADKKVILATPTTLIALLRAVHYGWRQEKLAENAERISDVGREIYDRLSGLAEHVTKLGRHLDNAVDSYNKAAGTLESRVLVSARKLKDYHAVDAGKELKVLEQIEHTTRTLQAIEFRWEEEPPKIAENP